MKMTKTVAKLAKESVDREELEDYLKILDNLAQESRREKRQAWAQEVLQVAQSHGDTRDPEIILRDAGRRGAAINAAFKDSTNDRETAETICLNDKWLKGREEPLAEKGEVLTRTNQWASPILDPNKPY
jgi:CHASE3 domain sensor protein